MPSAAEISLLSAAVELILQTLAYGVFLVLAVVSTSILVKRGWRTRSGIIMLGMIWTMFTLSTAHWTMSLVFAISQIVSSASLTRAAHPLHDLLTAVGKANFGFADAVLVWRAWVLCKRDYRKLLFTCFVLLGLTIVFIFCTIIFRFACNEKPEIRLLTHALDVSQVALLVVSMLTNLLSTSIVGAYVWKYRQQLHIAFTTNETTTNTRVLMLLVESGLFYTAYVFISGIGSLIRLPIGTIGDISSTVLIHISGVYPTLIITLASIKGTMSSSVFSARSSSARRSATIAFARPPSTVGSPTNFVRSFDINEADDSRERNSIVALSPIVFSQFADEATKSIQQKWEQVQGSAPV